MQAYEEYDVPQATILTAWRLIRCNPTGGYGLDPPSWPPVGYNSGDRSRVRTVLDDEASRRAALGLEDDTDGVCPDDLSAAGVDLGPDLEWDD